MPSRLVLGGWRQSCIESHVAIIGIKASTVGPHPVPVFSAGIKAGGIAVAGDTGANGGNNGVCNASVLAPLYPEAGRVSRAGGPDEVYLCR